MIRNTFIALAAGAGLAALGVAAAQAAPFYQGKTVKIITSTGAGGSYDLTARAVSRHMPDYLPGKPQMIVQNMPGGGNVRATNYMYNVAPKDGTVLATVHNFIPLHQVLGGPGIHYDASKFNWLGSPGAENEVVLVWHTAHIKTFDELQKKVITVGGTGAGSGLVITPEVMNNVMGTKFKIVIGYKSSENINLAMERGEVQARLFGINSIIAEHPDWITKKIVTIPAQQGNKRDKAIPNVPLLTELGKGKEQREILKLISSPVTLGKPYLAPPGVPEARVALLRKAFQATLRDKGFLADMKQLHLDVDPISAEEITRIVHDTIDAPAGIVAKAKDAMKPPREGYTRTKHGGKKKKRK